ncbi:MAG TPA: restriction endonuclease [Thermodesulfobacteriota bacterium]
MPNMKFIILTILLFSLIPSSILAGKLYKWVDQDGVVHVTDKPETVPKEHRSSGRELSPKNSLDRSVAKVKELWNQARPQKNPIGIGIGILAVILVAYKLLFYTRRKLGEIRRGDQLRALELSGIDDMNPVEFTDYIAKVFEHRGFKVQTPDGSLNLGVDLITEKDNVKYAVQLERQSSSVSRPVLNNLEREKHRYGCERAIVITKAYFTEDAAVFAKSKACDLVDRETLSRWVSDFEKKRG